MNISIGISEVAKSQWSTLKTFSKKTIITFS